MAERLIGDREITGSNPLSKAYRDGNVHYVLTAESPHN